MSRNRIGRKRGEGSISSPRSGLAVQELINSFEREENSAAYANWLESAGPDQLPQGCARDLQSFADFRNGIGELWSLNVFHSKSPFDGCYLNELFLWNAEHRSY